MNARHTVISHDTCSSVRTFPTIPVLSGGAKETRMSLQVGGMCLGLQADSRHESLADASPNGTQSRGYGMVAHPHESYRTCGKALQCEGR